MKFAVSETARLLQTDRDTVKSWAFHFREHLSSGANPTKGETRSFTAEDLQVLAFVCSHWEAEPDVENIRYGLNYDSHHEEPYRSFVAAAIPLFQEPPESLDETWRHGSLIGGIVAGTFDIFTLADSYRRAGDLLVEAALDRWEVPDLVYPVLYNYRHATELYLKAVVSPRKLDHDLKPLLAQLEEILRSSFKAVVPGWFKGAVQDFVAFDPDSTRFRYGEPEAHWGGEYWVDLPHVKERMAWVADSFHRILREMTK